MVVALEDVEGYGLMVVAMEDVVGVDWLIVAVENVRFIWLVVTMGDDGS